MLCTSFRGFENRMDQTPRSPSGSPGGSGSSGSSALAQLDAYAEQLRVKVPVAPENVLEGYVKWAPWVAMVLGALSALAFFAALGVAAYVYSYVAFVYASRSGASYVEELVFSLLLAVGYILGGYWMLQGRLNGWWLVAAALVVNMLQDLLSGALIGLLITLVVAWVHLQVKPRYSQVAV